MAVTYTTIGYITDTGEIFADHVEAESGYHALKLTAEARPGSCLIVAMRGQFRESIERENPRDFGALSFPGELVTDAETFLNLYEKEP